ncbi:MAG: DEAD/DEAH box helicase [Chitinophagaceae bacterium]|nr:DEAD/DEAH box helicase [Chitinophagaceae bacterium]
MQQVNIPTKKILANLKIEALNEMQEAAVKAIDEHDNVLLLSKTGSGKTLAFLLPIIQQLDPAIKTVQALVLAPSRELAIQIDEVFRKIGSGYKVTCCYGGHKREIEENNLLQSPAVIIGTAGRIADHIRRNNFSNEAITTLVLDEFDKSLELGFKEEMEFIIGSLPVVQKRILTSATNAPAIPDFVKFNNPVKVEFLSPLVEKEPVDELLVQTVHSPEKDKVETLFRLICQIGNKSMIVFCNHRESVERTSELLQEKGIVTVFYHGGMEQYERESAMCKFKNGTANVLITTDLASRGLDIPNIKYIIHFHLPPTPDVYTHRNGRTARMTAGGKSILILSYEEKLPAYITEEVTELELHERLELPEKPKWTTLFIDAGKKDKINKMDIVGFLSKVGLLNQEDIGLIEVKDFTSFVAVRKLQVGNLMELIKDEKIKGKKVKIAVAK